MANQPVTREKLINADIDVDNLGKASSELGTVNPRYGNPYKTAPQAIQDIEDNGIAAVAALNAKADQVVAQGFYKGYTTEAILLAAKPTVSEMRARADDTRKIYRWNRTSAEGVTPVAGTWTDTGLSDRDIAAADATTKANAAEANAKIYTQSSAIQSATSSNSFEDVHIAMTDSRGARTWLEATESGDLTEFAKKKILDGTNSIAPVKSKYAETASVVFVDELGRVLAIFGGDDDNSSTAQTRVDLSTWAFFGSSSMMYLQDDVFNLLQSNFDQVHTAKYYGTSASRMQHTLANIGVNNASLTFMGGAIDNTARAVTSTGFDFGIPTIHTVRGILENGVTGIYKDATFTADNQSLSVSTTTPIKFISDGSRHRNAVALVNIGKNNVAAVGSDVGILAGTRAAVEYLDEANDRHTIVLGHFVNTDQTEVGKANIISLNNSLRSIYFDRFIDIQAYLMGEQVWIDVGLTKTQADIDAIAAGVLPPSLGRDAAHLSAAVDTKLAEKILDLVISKGWYA